MTIKDFAAKEADIVRQKGVSAAVRSGASEAGMKALGVFANQLSTPIWETDWDVCLVLDACRLDLWKEVADMWYGTDSRWSVGSASPEWIGNTFSERYRDHWENAGYVTANPFSGKQGGELPVLDPAVYPLADRGLAHLDEVWRDEWPATDDLPTVAPETVTNRALWAWQHRDSLGVDHLVVHYMQPHIPFRSKAEWCDGWELDGFGSGGGKGKDDWHRVRDGELDADEFWQAYRDNLQWVLMEVERWRRETDARILVTSDHGNAMGEWGEWSHPPRSGNPVLRRVPWVTLEGEGRGVDVETLERPPERGDATDGEIEERLQALGYV